MPNDLNGDIQIKPATPATGDGTGGATSSATPVNGSGTPVQNTPTPATSQPQPSSNQSTNTSATPTTTATPAAPTTSAPTPTEPVNKRAFNLDADVESSSTGMAKPEKFAIPKMVKDKYPDLIDLIKNTESMDDQERQYWFQIMPVMTTDQVEKFKNILITEKQQLSELDKEYEDELTRLNEKHLLEWKEFESKEKSRAIQEAEAKSDEAEKHEEEALLAKLSDV